jgi:hypothetical protein
MTYGPSKNFSGVDRSPSRSSAGLDFFYFMSRCARLAGFWVKPKIGTEAGIADLSVSFFDWAKNETQKSPQVLPRSARVAHPSTALRRATALACGTTWNSRSKIAQTTRRSDRALAPSPNSPDRARPGETTVLVTLDVGTESRNVPPHPFALARVMRMESGALASCGCAATDVAS